MNKTSKTSSTESSNDKDDGLINFRPSPNFKHMKKYRKWKFEEDINNLIENEKKLEVKNKVIQPPLPPNSPPPDSPLSIVLKQEVEDDEYEQAADEPAADEPAADEPAADEPVEEPRQIQTTPQQPEHKKPIMCKDFVRKTCTRGSACIYAHKIDFSQLKGVYKFCRDFENGCCERPVCYFVHATTFEKEDFLKRTAELPPHVFAHLNTPPTQPTTEVQKEVPPMFTRPPPQVVPSVAAAPLGPLPVGKAPHVPPPATAAPLKREWRDIYDFGSPPRDLDAKEPLAKKCKRCELTELRLQHSKTQVAQAMRSSREMDEKLEYIIKKNNRLHGVLRVLLKPRRTMEHVNNSFLAPSRLPAPPLADDAGKEALLAQMKVLLTKILLGGEGSPERAAAGS